MKQGLKHASSVENLVEDGVEKLDCCSCFFIDLILLIISTLNFLNIHNFHQSIFKVIITVLIEHAPA